MKMKHEHANFSLALELLSVLSATTFCTSVREFSPLGVCAGETKMAPLGGFREPDDRFGPAQWFGRDDRADRRFTIVSATVTPDVLSSVGDRHEQLACRA